MNFLHSSATFLLSALAFIVLLTLLIILHEVGHYSLARLFGVDVEEFGFGLPPRAKKLFYLGTTLFSLNWVPFGGFVRLKGENSIDLEHRNEPGSFAATHPAKRMAILAGGVAMNFFLAYALLVLGFSVGRWVPSFYQTLEDLQVAEERGEISLETGVYISEVVSDGPASKAGVLTESAIRSVDGIAVSSPEEVVELQKGKSAVTYLLVEGKEKTERSVTISLIDGKAGVGLSPFVSQLSGSPRSLGASIVLAGKESVFMTRQTVKGMVQLARSLLFKAQVPEGITGIVGIAVLTHSTVQDGFMAYLRLVALLSLSLAILNILPLPALDGGRLLFVFIEVVLRRPLNQRFELLVNALGFFLLISLIVIITLNDVVHLF